MKLYKISLAGALALACGANAVEVTPFGHIGAFYQQGAGNLGTKNKDGNGEKTVQRAYANASARLGLELGFTKTFSIGLGGWGAFPFYTQGTANSVREDGKIAIPQYGDVSDAYFKYDTGKFSFAGGRFDIGKFYLGQDGKNYTGVDWIFGNIQGAALNVGDKSVSFWALWMNSQLGAGQAYNRMGYELSSFGTYAANKKNRGELFYAGLDFNFGAFKISPFAMYQTDLTYTANQVDALKAGAKAQLDLGSGALTSTTIVRGAYDMTGISKPSNYNTQSTITAWIDEELRYKDIIKFGGGYIWRDNKDGQVQNYGDRSRFYGYRGGFVGPHTGSFMPTGKGMGTWYAFGGVESNRFALDLLYSGGSYEEMSAVASIKLIEWSDSTYFQVGGGYVGTRKYAYGSNNANNAVEEAWKNWQHSVMGFAKLSF